MDILDSILLISLDKVCTFYVIQFADPESPQ